MTAEEVQAVQNVLYFNYPKENTLLQFHGNKQWLCECATMLRCAQTARLLNSKVHFIWQLARI